MSSNAQCIQNNWEKGSGPLFESFNPATGASVWQGHSAGEAEIERACQAAYQAFETWSNIPFNTRSEYMLSFRDELEKEKENLTLIIAKETGKPLWESRGEVEAMIGKIPISISAYQQRCHNTTLPQPTQVIKTFHKPHGVAVVLGPFNFPGHLPNGHIVPALLAGNTVVFKPSELTPAVGEAIMRIWQKSGLPKGVLNLIQGGRETGSILVEKGKFNALFFTGSWETGKWLSERFGEHPEKILALEMGGNNPLFIDEVQDKRTAAYLTVQSAFLTAGQRCSCARRLLILDDSEGDTFLEELIALMSKIQIGPYDSIPEPFMGPVINLKAAHRILEKQEALIKLGAKPLVPLKQIQPTLPFLTPGLLDVDLVAELPDEEIFGPILQVSRVKNLHDAIKKANQTTYGLCAGILSDKSTHFDAFYRHVKAGIINWNSATTGASSAAPFGGIGRSGNHRPSAYYAADYCSYPVVSTESFPLQKPPKLSPGISI